MEKKKTLDLLKNGLIKENPVFVMLLGMCPTLAITTSLDNALGMGLSVTFVLICSNLVISSLRKVIPAQIRIAAFVVIIAGFVSVVEMLLKAYVPGLSRSLGIFIPLIAVNCLIFARAEAFAYKNKMLPSILDGLSMGIGFTLAISILGGVREILGNGTILGMQIFGEPFQPMIMAVLAPGAFIILGIILAFLSYWKGRKKNPKEKRSKLHKLKDLTKLKVKVRA